MLTESTIGPEIGVEVARELSADLKLALQARYFVPVAFTYASNGQTISGLFSSMSIKLGVDFLYRLSGNWGVGAGVSWETGTLNYVLQSNNEQLTMSGFGANAFAAWGF